MIITRVQISLPSSECKEKHPCLLAFVELCFDNALVIHDIKLIDGEFSPFLAFPSRERHTFCKHCNRKTSVKFTECKYCRKPIEWGDLPKFMDIVHPVSSTFRSYIQQEVIKEYNSVMSNPVDTPSLFSAGII